MPSLPIPRHATSLGYYDELGVAFVGDRAPYFYRKLADNQIHKVVEGDTLYNLAYKYYGKLSNGIHSAAQLWWIIADFQPEPIHDPTMSLSPGSYLVIPSIDTVQSVILTREAQ